MNVLLSDEDSSLNIFGYDVSPGNVCHLALTPRPRFVLEDQSVEKVGRLKMLSHPCSKVSVFHGPVLEHHIVHVSRIATLAQTSNRQSMTRVATISVLYQDIVATIRYIDTVVTVMTVVAVEGDISTANGDAVGVCGEAFGGMTRSAVRWRCVNEMVGDLYVAPRNAETPSDRLNDLDVGDFAGVHVKRQ
jgi:hypothetical protein